MTSEALKRAQRKYNKKMKTFLVRLDPDRDAAVLEQLARVPNKSNYIKNLILSDIGGKKNDDQNNL